MVFQGIIWTNTLLTIGPLETHSCQTWIKIQYFPWDEMHLKSRLQNVGRFVYQCINVLTHWGLVTHICVGNLTNTGSNNGFSPGGRQAIILTNAGIMLIGTLGTNFNGILIKIQTFSFKIIHLKMSSGKWRSSCLAINVLTIWYPALPHARF